MTARLLIVLSALGLAAGAIRCLSPDERVLVSAEDRLWIGRFIHLSEVNLRSHVWIDRAIA